MTLVLANSFHRVTSTGNMTCKSSPEVDSPNAKFHQSSVIPVWLDGEEVVLASTFDVVSPVDHKLLYRCSSCSEENANNAVEAANKAFKSWSRTKPSVRRDIFLRAAEEFGRRKDELRHYTATETGAEESYFEFEYALAQEACRHIAGLIQVALTGAVPIVAEEQGSAMLLKEPYGVVLGIAPWNAPYVLGLRACLQPLAMGNTVVLKGPEVAPATYWAIASVLHSAGLPSGCVNTVYHRQSDAARITKALIEHPAVKKINFTGSTAVGSIIGSLAGRFLKATVMELGGKASAIVCEDADIPQAVLRCATGALLHAGQICMSTERILVHRKITEEFRRELEAMLKSQWSQDGHECATLQLISELPVRKNQDLVSDALSKGAKRLLGEDYYSTASNTQMRPVILEGVTKGMNIYGTESFGPTTSLMIVDSDEEAVEIANDTEYGLSNAVFTKSLNRGLKIARQLESGAVHINGMTVHDEAVLPHGGVKRSGFGRFNSLDGLNEWVKLETVTWRD